MGTRGALWTLSNIRDGKHPCQSLFFNKVGGLRPATLLKKTLWQKCFSTNFAKSFKNTFLRKHLLETTCEHNEER